MSFYEDNEYQNMFELNNPLDLGGLCKDGTHFELKVKEEDIINEFEDFNLSESSSDEDADINCIDKKNRKEKKIVELSPADDTFDALRCQMIKVNNFIYKKIVIEGDPSAGRIPDQSRVVLQYSAYWEDQSYPFDSTFLRGVDFEFYCGKNEVLEGLELSVRTMLKGEKSEFLISYKLLFGEMGCPPRIKAKSDALFVITVVDFYECGDESALKDIKPEDENKFSVIYDKAVDAYLRAKDSFRIGKINHAIKLFLMAVDKIQLCYLGNVQEEQEKNKFLIKLYTNLAVCYNLKDKPLKVCTMCNELSKITNIHNLCKPLFQKGRALFKLGEYSRAKVVLMKAQKLEPNNKIISKELRELDKKWSDYEKNTKNIWRKALGIVKSNDDNNKKNEENSFEKEVRQLLSEFGEDELKDITLPDFLTTEEFKVCKDVAKEFNYNFQFINDKHSSYYAFTKIHLKE